MNVTFLIGNGFDLNLGLNTRYSDFYKYFIEKYPNNKISKEIQDSCEMWSDLELGLGNYLNKVNENTLDDYLSEKEEMENALIDYLHKEEHRFRISDTKSLSTIFQNKIKNLSNGFDEDNKNFYRQLVLSSPEQINFSFITFNYTNTLDKIIECVSKNCSPFHTHIYGNNTKHDTISMPLHIHGTLDDNEMILGLNDVSQINNDVLKNNTDLIDCIIKTNVNQGLGQGKIKKAKEMINQSRYICLFGLSIGDTDNFWWLYLIDWLLSDRNHHLILFVNSQTQIHSAQQTIRFRKKYKQNFLKKSIKEIPDAVINQIMVIPNSQIFNFGDAIQVEFSLEKELEEITPTSLLMNSKEEELIV